MGFVGPATRLGDSWLRPHDLDLRIEPCDGAVEAMVQRIVHLGFEVRVELETGDGAPLTAQLTRDDVEHSSCSRARSCTPCRAGSASSPDGRERRRLAAIDTRRASWHWHAWSRSRASTRTAWPS